MDEINPLLARNSEMNLSLEGIKMFDDLIPVNFNPCFNHELQFQNSSTPKSSEDNNSKAQNLDQDENLDNIYMEVKSGSKYYNYD